MGARRIDGVDLSHFQSGKLDYARAKTAGVKFIYHKATEGSTVVDALYDRRRIEADAANIRFGAYHFAHPRIGNAASEAAFFLKHATPKPGDLMPVLDLEVNEQRMTRAELTTWVNNFTLAVYRKLGYTGLVLYTPFDLDRVPEGVRLWVARYSDANNAPKVPKPFTAWTIWQFSNGNLGTPDVVPGMGRVDINTLSGYPWGRLARITIPAKPTPWPSAPKPVVKAVKVGEAAITRFRNQGLGGVGMCLKRVRLAYQIGAVFPSASKAWAGAKRKHYQTDPTKIPRGYPVFWTGGSQGFGHIAISLGGGYCLSTDVLRPGYVDRVKISTISSKWGLRLVGWTEDLNGVTIK